MGIIQTARQLALQLGQPLIRKYYSGIGHILMFHSVVPSRDHYRISNDHLEVTPEHLEMVILFFKRNGYDIISLDELHGLISSKERRRRFVVFTFDDGYLNNLQYAYPVFKKHNAPFAVYVTTNFPDKKAIIWWYPLEDVLFQNKQVRFNFKGQSFEFFTRDATEKLAAFYAIRNLIQSCPAMEVAALLSAIFLPYNLDIQSYSNRLSMTWEDLEKLAQDPLVTIGAHTINHFRLNTLTEEQVKSELLGSKIKLETGLERKIDHFSYPFGSRKDVGPREFRIAKEVGFKTATTTRFGSIFKGHQKHMYALPRINIDLNVNEKELCKVINGQMHFYSNRGKRIISI